MTGEITLRVKVLIPIGGLKSKYGRATEWACRYGTDSEDNEKGPGGHPAGNIRLRPHGTPSRDDGRSAGR